MTTQEIQQYIDAAIRENLDNHTSESGEMMTSEGGDGRFLGKVIATRYFDLPGGKELYLAIGETAKGSQIIKFGDSECLKPGETELDLLLLKELGIEMETPGGVKARGRTYSLNCGGAARGEKSMLDSVGRLRKG